MQSLTSLPRSPVGAVPYGSRRRGARNSGRATPLPASRARRSSLILIAARQSCLVRQLRAQADRNIFHSPGAAGRGRWERVVSKKYVPWSPGPIRKFSETHRGTHPYFFGTVGLGNRNGTNAMIRSDRFIAGIAIVSIIASLGYIALTLIG
jgi:hypothetical protein